MWDVGFSKTIFRNLGYIYEDHLDIIFDLSQGEDKLWDAIHPTRRKQINRSIKRGTIVKIVKNLSQEEFGECYSILKQVYRKARIPLKDENYLVNAFIIFGPLSYINAILAICNNRIIGFRFFLTYKEIIYDWYAGSDPIHKDKYVNDLLPWEVMKWGKANGFLKFDFGGAGNPKNPYGVRDYKLKFGGELVNNGRMVKIHRPILMAIGRLGFKVLQVLKS